jgi:hypothetical protein
MTIVRDQGLPEVIAEVDATVTAENGIVYKVFAGQPVPPSLVSLYEAATSRTKARTVSSADEVDTAKE